MCIVRFCLHSHAIRPERWFTLVVVLFALVNQAEADERPNILFIYTDDHSHRTVGCYDESYEFVRTPNIDRLASDGVRFRYAYMGTWCMPSRATMLTGITNTR
jgi:arylsulfatase A-like enzyme